MAEHEDGWIGADNWLVRELQKAFAERDAARARAEAAERRAGELAGLIREALDDEPQDAESGACAFCGALDATAVRFRDECERLRAIETAAREVVYQSERAWAKHRNDMLALGSDTQYYVLPVVSRLRRMLASLDTEGEDA